MQFAHLFTGRHVQLLWDAGTQRLSRLVAHLSSRVAVESSSVPGWLVSFPSLKLCCSAPYLTRG